MVKIYSVQKLYQSRDCLSSLLAMVTKGRGFIKMKPRKGIYLYYLTHSSDGVPYIKVNEDSL
jgi:hypothetical protein